MPGGSSADVDLEDGTGMLRIHLCGEMRVEGTEEHSSGSPLAARQGRLAFAFLVAERHRAVSREELADVLWGDELPPSWTTSVSAIVSKLRRFLSDIGLDGQTALASTGSAYRLNLPDGVWIDIEDAADAVARAEHALVERDAAAALVAALHARDIAALDFSLDDSAWGQDFRSRLRDLLVRAVHAQAEAVLLAGDAKRAIAPAREVVALEPFREAGYRVLMRAHAGAGERAEALRTWERCRELFADELGTDPAPETEAVHLEILRSAVDDAGLPTGVVTFLVTDIERSSELWEAQPHVMNEALQAHDRTITDVVTQHGGRVVKGLGDGTFAVFRRASGAAAAALALRDAFAEGSLRVRFAVHTGEAFERDGDYFGPTANRVSRMAAIATAGQIVASQATVEVLRDQDVPLRDLGVFELKGLSRAEHLYEVGVADEPPGSIARERPPVPSALAGAGPFVGRSDELEALAAAWERAKGGAPRAVLLGGEPGVGKTRLSGECSRRAYDDGALVLYGRCDEDLAAPYQPFAQAARTIVDYWGPARLRSLPGIEEIARLVPEIATLVPGLPSPTRGEPEEERYVLFDALARLFVATSEDVPVVLVLDDLHWAAKPTLLLLRHLLRFASQARLLIVGTYRDTELDRAHPLAGVLVDLHRDDVVDRISLGGLEVDAVAEYAAATGHDDPRLPHALVDVTSGVPFFMIEVLRHIEESGGEWDARTLPQGVKEATGRRLSRLSQEANDALLVAAISGSVFSLDLVEQVSERECVDDIEEARHAGLVVESDSVGQYRFAHALVRQVLLSEVATVKRLRLHLKIAAALEETDADDAELAYHYFECAWGGHASKAAEYCTRAADRAMERLAYEEATDLYDKALQSMDVEPDAFDDEQRAALLLSRCEAAFAAGDISAATASIGSLKRVASGSRRLAAWATTFEGQLAILVHPDRLRETERAVAAAAQELSQLGDLSGAAQAHTIHANCLFRLGRVAECETSLDAALTAARAANDHRRVNAMLAQAPVAALYGPSPVPRAGGRCLDIVRQLRITTGSPAVEAVAIRCQAVLESFRGRTQAARRMLDNAREMLEQLGHRVGLLEVDLFGGLVELVAGEPEDAERLLRKAYDGFVELGLDADAGHAAARLARACVRLGRMDEAYELTELSERLGGQSPESAVIWRCARAEVLADRGDVVEARRLAEEAVAMSESTDKPSEQGIAHMALASVLRAAGDERGARAEAERAATLAERKGAIALVENARAFAGEGPPSIERDSPTTTTDVTPNACAFAMRRFSEAVVAGDIEAAARLMAPDNIVDDRRRLVRTRFSGIDVAASIRAFGVRVIHHTLIATRGERLSLHRSLQRGSTSDSFETEFLILNRINEEGLADLGVVFDPDDLDAAFDELNEQFIAGEGAPYADVVRAIINRDRSFQGVTYADHRPAPLPPTTNLADHIARGGGVQDMLPNIDQRVAAFLALNEHGAVLQMRIDGTTTDGSPYEWRYLIVGGIRDGKVKTVDVYPIEALDDALARFAALGVSARPLENACTRATDRFRALIEQERWEEVTAALAEDFRTDPRAGYAVHTNMGREAYVDWQRAGVEPWGDQSRETTTLAVRGERLALRRFRRTRKDEEAAEFMVEMLLLWEIDDDELIKSVIAFAYNDLDGAFAELDARYVDGEGAPFADVFRTSSTSWGDHVTFVDHRPGGFGSAGTPEQIGRIRASARELPRGTKTRVISVLAIDENGALLHHLTNGELDGAPYEWSFLRLGVVDGRRLTHVEIFQPEAADAALARFAALRPQRLENGSTRSADRLGELVEQERWEEVRALLAADFTFDMKVQNALVRGKGNRDGFVTNLRANAETWGRIERDNTVIATRGDRLCLRRLQNTRADDGYTTELLIVHEVDDAGSIQAMVGFGPDDLAAAVEELDNRYLAGEGGPFADAYRTVRSAWNQDVWDERITFVDHRPGGFGRAESVQELDAVRLSGRFMPRGTSGYVVSVLAIDERAALLQFLASGDDDGATYEWTFLRLGIVDDGRLVRFEMFPADAVEIVRARFAASQTHRLENDSCRVCDRLGAAIRDGRWDDAADLLHDDYTFTTPRPNASGNDKRSFIDWAQSLPDVWGTSAARVQVLGIRGERLSLIRRTLERPDDGAAAFVRDSLAVREIDEQGLLISAAYFEPEDLDAAFEELDRRYAEGEGAAYAEELQWAGEYHTVLRAQDWDRARTYIADDALVVDHRPGGWGTIRGKDDWLAHARPMFEQSPDYASYARQIHAMSARGRCVHFMTVGTNASGGEIGDEYISLSYRRPDGLLAHWEVFPLEDVDAALRRLEELERSAPPLANSATRVTRRLRELLAEDDFDGVASLLADDFSFRSASRKGLAPRSDKIGYIDWVRSARDAWGGIARDAEVLAIRGERLTLHRIAVRRAEDDGYRNDFLAIHELGANGLIAASVYFDIHDLDEAFEELDRRYRTGEARPFADVFDVIRARDPFQHPDLYADDMVIVDHRPGSLLDVGSKQEWRDHHQVDRREGRGYVIAVHALDKRGGVVERTAREGNEEDAYEWGFIFVRWVRNGRIVRSDLFNDDQLDEALAFFASHCEPARLENACTRLMRRLADAVARRESDTVRRLASKIHYWEDRRKVLRMVAEGPEVGARLYEDPLLFTDTIDASPMAIRGEDLAVFQMDRKGSESDESRWLALVELGPEDLPVRIVRFDADDLAAAAAELEKRFMAGEAAPYADAYRVLRSSVVTSPEAFAPDVVMIDHRPGSAVELHSRDELLAYAKEQIGALERPEAVYTAVRALNNRGVVFETMLRETSDDANAVEYGRLFVRFIQNGRIVRQDVFGDDQLDEALAFFETHREPPRLENLATRTRDGAWGQAVRNKDAERLIELAAPDYVTERRMGNDLVAARMDIHQFIDWLRTQDDAGFQRGATSSRTLAIRGDTLVLFQIEVRSDTEPGAFVYNPLIIREVTEDGLTKRNVYFEPDDLSGALEELDRSYLATLNDDEAKSWRIVLEALSARTAQDWARYRAVYPEHFVVVDHGPGSMGTRSRDEMIVWSEQGHDLTRGRYHYAVAVHGLTSKAVCATHTARATSPGGTPIEWTYIVTSEIDDGTISRTDMYPLEALDEALERFRGINDVLENVATRHHRAVGDAIRRRDLDGLAGLFAPDFVSERRMATDIVPPQMNAKEFTEWVRSGAYDAFTFGWHLSTTLAVRGDRLALFRVELRSDGAPGAFEHSYLLIRETTPEGLGKAALYFADDDIDDAYAELEERYLAGLDDAGAHVWKLLAANIAAHNARDWQAYADTYADDFGATMHLPIETTVSAEDFDKEGMVAYMRAAVGIALDRRLTAPAVHALGRHAVCAAIKAEGTTPEGTLWTVDFQITFAVRDGRLARFDVFAHDQLDAALARFGDLEN